MKLTVVIPQGQGETEGINEFIGVFEYKTDDKMGYLTITRTKERSGDDMNVATFAPGAWLRVIRSEDQTAWH